MNKEIMKALGFKAEVDAVESGRCPSCKEPINPATFQDDLSLKEFRISGLCQKCQDDIFGE